MTQISWRQGAEGSGKVEEREAEGGEENTRASGMMQEPRHDARGAEHVRAVQRCGGNHQTAAHGTRHLLPHRLDNVLVRPQHL
jgi:hypothetical protein